MRLGFAGPEGDSHYPFDKSAHHTRKMGSSFCRNYDANKAPSTVSSDEKKAIKQ